jgi:Domain of unknown function (DUF222)
VIAQVLDTPPARRLSPQQWAGAEEQLAAQAPLYTPKELRAWGTALIEALDHDGAEPDDRPPAQVNELFLTRLPDGGGKLRGRLDDAAMFDAIAAMIDATAKPLTGDDDRGVGRRQAEALADICRYVLDHGDLPQTGGHRPHLNVLVRLEDLENRARTAAGLRRPDEPAGAADAVLRRGSRARRAQRHGPAARRRPGDPNNPRWAAPRSRRPGPRVRLPRVRPPGVLDRMSPRDAT